MRRLVVGNWKMNGTRASLGDLRRLASAAAAAEVDVIVAPPFTLLADAAREVPGVPVAGQDCHRDPAGAHTGSVSAAMIREAGAAAVILGHSERRRNGESDADVAGKVAAAASEGLVPIVCVGETWGERERGTHLASLRAQVAGSLPEHVGGGVVAYEPVWAIGSGRTPSAEEIAEALDAVASVLETRADRAGWRLLYGGSVSEANAGELVAVEGLHGFLVGGASLSAEGLLPIIAASGRGAGTRIAAGEAA